MNRLQHRKKCATIFYMVADSARVPSYSGGWMRCPGKMWAIPIASIPLALAVHIGPSKAANVQRFSGKVYQAVDMFALQKDLNDFCQHDAQSMFKDKRVAFLAAYKPTPQLLFDNIRFSQLGLPNPSDHKSLWGYFLYANTEKVYKALAVDRFYRDCSGLNLNFCLIAVYGSVKHIHPRSINNPVLSWTIGASECVVEIDAIRKVQIQNRTAAGMRGAVNGAISGFKLGMDIFGR